MTDGGGVSDDDESPSPESPHEDDFPDATVEPFEGAVDGEADRERLAEGRKVGIAKYSPAKTRESMRVALGSVIVAAALIAGAAGAISAATSGAGTNTILTGVFSPLLGLAGAVVGFYFGGKDSST